MCHLTRGVFELAQYICRKVVKQLIRFKVTASVARVHLRHGFGARPRTTPPLRVRQCVIYQRNAALNKIVKGSSSDDRRRPAARDAVLCTVVDSICMHCVDDKDCEAGRCAP